MSLKAKGNLASLCHRDCDTGVVSILYIMRDFFFFFLMRNIWLFTAMASHSSRVKLYQFYALRTCQLGSL